MPNLFREKSSNNFTLHFWIGLIVLSICLVPTVQIGSYSGPDDYQEGDAPNSSVCRAALGNATTNAAKCHIARTLRGCQFDSGFFPYMRFQYCTFREQITPTIFMFLWLVILLGAFATIADSFFSPALIALARTLRMSQNLAGVTLLAFGNGAPDVFSALTAITTGDPDAPDEGLGLGFLLGSGLLVNTITAGLIMLIKPFKMSRRPFLKDSLFYFCAVAWSASILIRRRIDYADAIGFLCFYLFYVLLTWASGTLHIRQRKTDRNKGPGNFWPPPIQTCLMGIGRGWDECSEYVRRYRNFLSRHLKKPQDKAQEELEHPVNSNTNVRSKKVCWPEESTNEMKHQVANGSTAHAKLATGGITKAPQSKTFLVPPTIEVTEAQAMDHLYIYNHRHEGSDIHSDERAHSSTNLADLTELPMHYLSTREHGRPRSSSVGSNFTNDSRRRVPGFTRNKPHRTQSVTRRRASGRMSTIGPDLPYMVRWIIANRELEEKDLNAKEADTKRRSRTTSNELEGGAQDIRDELFSGPASRKTSRLGSTVASPTQVLSPTRPDFSISEDVPTKHGLGKKITLDLVPKSTLAEPVEEPASFTESMGSFPEEDVMSLETSPIVKWASKGPWHHFIFYISPIDIDEWPELPLWTRILRILQVPIFMVFRLTIPTVLEDLFDEGNEISLTIPVNGEIDVHAGLEPVTEEAESPQLSKGTPTESSVSDEMRMLVLDLDAMHGWCKVLNVAQCVIIPTLWPLLLTSNKKSIGLMPISGTQLPLFVPFTLGGSVIALIVYFTSKWDSPPVLYHRPFFATLGFLTSIIWIYALAHELVNSLETLGIVWEISEAILGLSVMAFASSIGDIMSNCLLARNGYPRIAYSACLGSPLFNLLLGTGLSYTIKIVRGDDPYANLSFTLTQAVLFSCLMGVLLCNVIIAVIFNFEFHRTYGIFLIMIYLSFGLIAILIEMDYIQSPKNWGLLTGTE